MLPHAFITGGSGLLGLNVLLHSPEQHRFYALENKRQIKLRGIETVKMDLGNLASIEGVLKYCSPQLVVHAAGMTNVDSCNEDPSKANFVNGTLPANLAKVCYELGIKFVHISTDHIFDGTRSFITEETPAKPLNEYGYSKAFGEEGVISNNPDALVVRCNFFGWGPFYKPSFSDFIFDNLSEGKSIRLADDVFYTPAVAQNLIEGIQSLVGLGASGVFNVVGSERLSKYEFGLKMAEIFEWDANLIERVSWESLGASAKRPADMSLSDRKVRKALGHDLGTAGQNIKVLKDLIDTDLYNKVKSI